MASVTIVFWRDIPAQIIVGKGRKGVKMPLSKRFEQAIDRAAMKSGAAEADAYLADWRRGDPYDIDGPDDEVARAEISRLEADYDTEKLRALIDNQGRA